VNDKVICRKCGTQFWVGQDCPKCYPKKVEDMSIEEQRKFVADDMRKAWGNLCEGVTPEGREEMRKSLERVLKETPEALLRGEGLRIGGPRDKKIHEKSEVCQERDCERKATWRIPYNKLDTTNTTEETAVYVEAWLPLCDEHRAGRGDVTLLKAPEDVFNALISLQLPPIRYVMQTFEFPVKEEGA
jgi:hypothetical protein